MTKDKTHNGWNGIGGRSAMGGGGLQWGEGLQYNTGITCEESLENATS